MYCVFVVKLGRSSNCAAFNAFDASFGFDDVCTVAMRLPPRCELALR